MSDTVLLSMTTTPDPQTRHHEVIVVGAGFAGIGAAIKLRQAGLDFLVLEKSAEIGGVWRDNSYPGCACDVPSAFYSYSFAPNPRWSRFFARQGEIRAYTHAVADRFGVMPSVRVNHELLAARWDSDQQVWRLQTSAGDYSARFVIMACGPMHKPVTPRIKGIASFPGASFHSARWDHGCDLAGKRVAVIGSGASAIQFVPAIQPDVAHLTLFQRTPPWVLPKMDAPVSERWQRRFERFPVLQHALRQMLYLAFEKLNNSLTRPRSRGKLQARALRNIHRTVKDERLRAVLTPDYAIGCKRILQSNDWYRALVKENVDVVGGVAEVRGKTIIASDGSSCEADIIIYATGFEVANPPVAEIITGVSGETLATRWQGSPQAYLGTMVEDCPNLFMMFGPNLYTFSSAFVMIEAQLKYIMSALRTVTSRRIRTVAVDPQSARAFNDDVQAALQTSVWNAGGCQSYFIDKNGRNSTNWPWTTGAMRRRLKRFRLKDYVVDSSR
ncbi:NAD(P)/FAD-dependent oxidoreductase [uncultured Maricaulis sp.]|uniref:flavin-containing monooxygenase n=1 Tax=uncultured Maricaulis sp. TaxID=174710 RepID=UPI0030D96687